MDAKINTFVNILPFGNIQYKSKGNIVPSLEEVKDRPQYQLPDTTDIESLKFNLVDDITIVIPYNAEIEEK